MPTDLLRSLWPARAAWVALGAAASGSIAGALAGAPGGRQAAVAVLAWGGWAAALLALLVPRAVGLTVVRAAAPAGVAATVAAAVAGPAGNDDAVAVGLAVLALAFLLSGDTADALVDGTSYGDERRFALRTPTGLWPAAAVAWLVGVALPVAGVVVLAGGAWVVGAVLTVLGAAGARLGVPALHRLSRRWLVFVPAGFVVHDHLALADPYLLRRTVVARVAPAEVGDAAAVDLTAGAGGLPVVVALTVGQDLPVASGPARARTVETVTAERFLVAPLRPGAVLTECRRRLVGVAPGAPPPTPPPPRP